MASLSTGFEFPKARLFDSKLPWLAFPDLVPQIEALSASVAPSKSDANQNPLTEKEKERAEREAKHTLVIEAIAKPFYVKVQNGTAFDSDYEDAKKEIWNCHYDYYVEEIKRCIEATRTIDDRNHPIIEDNLRLDRHPIIEDKIWAKLWPQAHGALDKGFLDSGLPCRFGTRANIARGSKTRMKSIEDSAKEFQARNWNVSYSSTDASGEREYELYSGALVRYVYKITEERCGKEQSVGEMWEAYTPPDNWTCVDRL
jgi:hypothetical protein